MNPFGRLAACVIATILVTVLPGAAVAGNVALSAAGASYVRAVCNTVLQAGVGTSENAACSASLTQTVQYQIEAVALASASAACRTSSSAASFSICLLDRRGSAATAPILGDVAAIAHPARLSLTSFGSSAFEERRRKEEYACAALGLSPDGLAFTQCVADLGSAMDAVESPMG